MPNWLIPLICLIAFLGFIGFAFRQGAKVLPDQNNANFGPSQNDGQTVMRWSRPYPTRGDVVGILFIVVLLGLISSSFYWFPKNSKPINYGFGPN